MNSESLAHYLEQGEGVSLEFKRCGNKPESDTFETICSFANRQGGAILLGVTDDGTLEGVDPKHVLDIERNIANVTSNPDLFSSAPPVEFEKIPAGDRAVIRVWVPMGPSVYRYKGVAYDRIADADVQVRGDAEVFALYLRKQNTYTERRVIPWITKEDLNMEVLERSRQLIAARQPEHKWLSLTDDQLIHDARLIGRDPSTGERGYNLAAVMLLGSDDLISDVVPAYRTDATFSRDGSRRYEDRLVVRTNIIDAYDQLVAFAERWLPDAFALRGMQRVDSRGFIVRELVCNMLIHREFTSPSIATIVISDEGIKTKNASRSLYSGRLTPEELDPNPKNPIIANFFTQLGRSEELGSGTRTLFEHSRYYSGRDPVLEEGNHFVAFVPSPASATQHNGDEDSEAVRDSAGYVRDAAGYVRDAAGYVREAYGEDLTANELSIVEIIERQGTTNSHEIMSRSGLSERGVQGILKRLIAKGVIEKVGAARNTRHRLKARKEGI